LQHLAEQSTDGDSVRWIDCEGNLLHEDASHAHHSDCGCE
jgi:hypothetical protein